MNTSQIALNKFTATDKKKAHYKIILNALNLCPFPLTSFGIEQRTKLDKHQISRRTLELENLNKIERLETKIDVDGATRLTYKTI